MEGVVLNAPVVKYLTENHVPGIFTLVDIGCAGGIDAAWRQFGHRLHAIGFDPNLDEISRLSSGETLKGVRYVPAYAGLPQTHPFLQKKGNRSDWGRNPWQRLSVVKAIDFLRKQDLTNVQQTDANLWQDVALAKEADTIVVPEYLESQGFSSVDFLKIDIDGKDFDVLNSFDNALESLDVLGAGLEVNFFGSDSETDHTFHNTDRFMKAHGFELFDLTVRHYSMAALPSRFVYSVPAQTDSGRIIQGDALYFRDLGNPDYSDYAAQLSAEKLLNLLSLFAVCNLPDCAAEIAENFRDRISTLCVVDRVLDLLAEQAQGDSPEKMSYAELMRRFEDQDAVFFRRVPEPVKRR